MANSLILPVLILLFATNWACTSDEADNINGINRQISCLEAVNKRCND